MSLLFFRKSLKSYSGPRWLLTSLHLRMISDSDEDAPVSDHPKQRPKRRRMIDPSSITTVPVYSNKVNSSLNLKSVTFQQTSLTEEEKSGPLWSPSPSQTEKQSTSIHLSDSEEEPQQTKAQEFLRSPSPPPPPCSPPVKQSAQANRKIKEINRKLDAIGSLVCLSPGYQEPVVEYRNSPSPVNDYDEDDEIIIISDTKRKRPLRNEDRDVAREISLKFRCRTELHKIPILSTAPLSKAAEQLSIKLNVLPSQILLLRKDVELPVHSSVSELGLGIADIIDCVVTENKQEVRKECDVISVRLQGKEKGSAQEYSVKKTAPLGSILSQYVSGLAASARCKVKFLFDGSRVTHNQTPAELDMEDGDVIEVWA
ncbi:NFATC2-interacting protein 45 kDa NF-AT-interacting protein [Triplophysa tibetana]|uniref:NFATC2-interacting protein n=1 Tax=Triplophysa tibetana TaxID=1572043 RepID=A0A5A9N9D0_9TELE|nr:NFATC2-interacting protein 45 kDa NF-AT-interacting protein [Triplophysa tibetana]